MDLSPRHFSRLFHSEVGITPATCVEEARTSAARRLLEQGSEAPKQVTAHCGFADADVLWRALVRRVSVALAEYRKRFAGGTLQAAHTHPDGRSEADRRLRHND